MTQQQIDTLFTITMLIHKDKWFGDNKNRRDREEVQEWVAQKLANTMHVYTIPCGMSWGMLVDKEKFDEYWEKNSKIEESYS